MFLRHDHLGITNIHPALAASDGELNVAPEERGGVAELGHTSSSNSSLPTVPSGGGSGVGKVASWAVSFERLLKDPTGVLYFTAFLRSEVSDENILFWQACERFRHIPSNHTDKLNQEARSIYTNFLSSSARYSVNVDDTVRVEEDMRNPQPDIFNSAQQQIFKLMKFDSYRRFVRSQLFQSCMLADVEGRPLPELSTLTQSPQAGHASANSSPSRSDASRVAERKLKEGSKLKPGRSPPVEYRAEKKRGGGLANKLSRDRRQDKRGSWGAELANHAAALQSDPLSMPRQAGAVQGEQVSSVGGAEKYCCVYLPDGTASLAPTRPGLPIRSMLIGLCEKRGLPLSDVTIYLQGKNKPLSMDQDSSILKEQQVYLDLSISLMVSLAWTGGTMGIVVKSSKTLQEVLNPLLQKHRLRPQDVLVTMIGTRDVLSMTRTVSSLTIKHITLERVKGGEQSGTSRLPPPANMSSQGSSSLPWDSSSTGAPLPEDCSRARQKRPTPRRPYDMDGLMELLSSAPYCCSVEDQRGLLKREMLTLPDFLQRPLDGTHTPEDLGPQAWREGQGEERRRTRSENGQMNSPARDVAEATPIAWISFPSNVALTQKGGGQKGPPLSQSPSPDPGRETEV
ncbi:regulator of G-protein signaling 14-like isoform X1 [Osmerus mordax]|uniref:regulator of G-protein signaling 14-like isoform X1 n=1 Tax=Osmerus mordax TaxID=8014 RepID=UPI00350F6A17